MVDIIDPGGHPAFCMVHKQFYHLHVLCLLHLHLHHHFPRVALNKITGLFGNIPKQRPPPPISGNPHSKRIGVILFTWAISGPFCG